MRSNLKHVCIHAGVGRHGNLLSQKRFPNLNNQIWQSRGSGQAPFFLPPRPPYKRCKNACRALSPHLHPIALALATVVAHAPNHALAASQRETVKYQKGLQESKITGLAAHDQSSVRVTDKFPPLTLATPARTLTRQPRHARTPPSSAQLPLPPPPPSFASLPGLPSSSASPAHVSSPMHDAHQSTFPYAPAPLPSLLALLCSQALQKQLKTPPTCWGGRLDAQRF